MFMYVHVLYVCACIFQFAFPPFRFSWRTTCLMCFFSQVMTNQFSQVRQCMYVSVLHVLYVLYVSACIVCIHLVFASIAATGTRITAASPNDSLLLRHPAGLTQGTPGHGRKHFFPPSLSPPKTRFRAPPSPPPSEVPEPHPPRSAG